MAPRDHDAAERANGDVDRRDKKRSSRKKEADDNVAEVQNGERDECDRKESHESRRHRSKHGRSDRERDSHRKRRHRSRSRSRSSERERRTRDSDRHRHRSSSPSKKRAEARSRSRSRSESKRVSGFDVMPPGTAAQMGMTLRTPFLMMPTQSMTQQATRHARRVYVGGLPAMVNEQSIAAYFNHVMALIGANTAAPGDAVVNVYINHEKRFAFVEMRTVEEASNAMALDGIMFENISVRVRRPSDYNAIVAAMLGPSQPSPLLNLGAVGLMSRPLGSADGPDRIFVGGLPYNWTETQVKELLESFGPLRGLDLVKDQHSGNSKGYGFFVYQDPSNTDRACAYFNGTKLGDKILTVRRATANGQPKPEYGGSYLMQGEEQLAAKMLETLMLQSGGGGDGGDGGGGEVAPTRVVCLMHALSEEELKDEEEYSDIVEDMREECGKYGCLEGVVIPRPQGNEEDGCSGVGKVFLQYKEVEGAIRAKGCLHGRKFGGKAVVATYYSQEKFSAGDYSG